MSKKSNNDILVIPDAHAHPEHDNERFRALGEYILEHRPSVVVCIGDLADFPALSSYDEGTRNAWGRLYRRDCDATIEAQQLLWAAVNRHNAQRAKNKKSQYKPRRIFCTGNHEDRADRFVNSHPAMDGFVDWRVDCRIDEFWDEIYKFKEEVVVRGMSFAHYFPAGLTGQAVSGVTIARTMALKLSRSAVQGHSHVLSYYYTDRGPGQPIIENWACGCYSHPGQVEGWNRGTTPLWRYGVLHLHDVDEGQARGGYTWREQSWILRTYSGS